MTQTEKEALRDYIVSYLIANSQTINGLPDVTSLDGISSFPVIQQQDGNKYIAKKVPFDMMITEFRYNAGYIQYKDLTTGNWINIISDVELAEKIDLSRYVNIDMDQIINGIKTFNDSPIVPDPTTSFQAVNKKYVDDNLSLKVDKSTEINSGNGITGGGDLSSDIILNIESANDGILINSDNIELQTVNDLQSESITKPLSSLQGKILNDTKVDKSIKINNYQLINDISLSKSDIGLSNVDNTSDVDKPISESTQNALNLKADLVNGQIPASQLPSYVDDILEYPNLLAFPLEGENGKLYIDLQYNLTYRWSGSIYVEISKSLALGETDSTAYRGDRGKVAYDHSLLKNNPHSVTKTQVGLSNVDNTSDINKPISTDQQEALNNKADKITTITAGNGLTGGGDLSGDVTFNVGNTDDSIVVGADGIKVDTQNSLTSTSTTKPLSAAQGKALQDNKVDTSRTITAGNGLTGGGDLTANRTIDINPADDSLVVTADNVKVNTNNTLTSTSVTQPLSANQGKVLNDKVAQVETNLKSKLGYIVCPTPAYTAGKVIVNAGFILTSGMRLLIKFTNENTVNTGVTLNINSTGDKPLIFRGKPVSYFNSWKAGEVVDVYYDGTNYMAEQLDSSNTELSELLKSVNADKSGIIGKNLINYNEYATGFLRSDNGNVTESSMSLYIKSYIPISSSKRYIISGFTDSGNRVAVFYNKEGKKIDTGWDSASRYSLASVDGFTVPAGRNFYILEPEASIAPDWKTNGLATLPIPAEASYIRLNAGQTNNANSDWRDTLMLEETTALIPSNYEKYGVLSSNINYTSFDKTLRESAIENFLVTNKFDVTKRKINKYLSSLDATEKNQTDIGGKSFAISDYIPIIGGKTYYLSGRFVNKPELPDATALVFYDDLRNPIKPIDINGNSYPSYRLPYLNGVVYAPINAVSVRFACMYYSTLQEISELQFINSSEPKEYIPFGSFVIPTSNNQPVLFNNTVLDGLIMLKSGNTYTGLRVEDIKILKSIVDEIYVLNDYTAGAKAKYQNYEIEYSNVLPKNGFALTNDGVLVFMKNGIRYNVNLTQA